MKEQHRTVRAALGEGSGGDARKRVEPLARAWLPHAVIEQELIFGDVDLEGKKSRPFLAGQVQRDLVNLVLADALGRDPSGDGEAIEARLAVLETLLGPMMQAEEKPNDGLYALAAKAGVDVAGLAPEIEKRAEDLKRHAEGDALRPPEPRSLRLSGSGSEKMPEEKNTMARRDMPDRDERGRFVSGDDYDRDYGRSRSARGRDRDEQGFLPEDDDRDYRRSRYDDDDRRYARSRYDDDDRRYGRDRGRGGWFGDPKGHAEAAHRGWEHRDDSRAGRRDDDDSNGRRGRGRDEDDDRR